MPGTCVAALKQILPLIPAPERGDMGEPYRAFLRFRETNEERNDQMLRLCLKSAERLELLGPGAVLLDLGTSGVDEALMLIRNLLSRLCENGVAAQAGIGSTGILAQLALFMYPISGRTMPLVPLVTARERSAFLCRVPVKLIPQLYPCGIINPDLMTRLDQYGLRTLGQIARLEELTLRRQFGVAAGTFLAAIASGDDPRPFSPTSLPPRQGFRLRFAIPASPERLLAALPYLSQSATELLRKRRLLARRLRIRLQWVEGDTRQTSETLRQPIVDMHLLSQELRRLALLLLINHSVCQSPEDREDQGAGEIEELQLFLEDEIVARSEQQILWSDQTQLAKFTDQQQRERKLAILQTISNTLARRHGHLHYSQPLLFRQCLSRPEAIFPEERFSREDFTSLSRWKDPPFSLRMTRSVAEHIGRKADTL